MYKIKSSLSGFSLTELLITMAIMGIVLAFSAPNLQKMISDNRLTTLSNRLVGALNIARSESIKRNKMITVAKIGTNWKDGWEVFVDLNNSGNRDTDEELLQNYEALPTNYLIKVTTAYKNYTSYRPDGRSNTNGSFYVCAPSANATFKRIIIAPSGRIRTESSDVSAKTYTGQC